MSDVAPITNEERETARKHFMPGVMREHGGIMRKGSVMQAYEARLTELEAALKEAGEALEECADAIRDDDAFDWEIESRNRARSVIQKIKAAGV